MEPEHHDGPKRPPYRPPIGIPTPGEPRARATMVSVLLHLLVVLLVVGPTIFVSARLIDAAQQGGGGPGPAGGGGGGAQGTGGADSLRLKFIQERLDFMKVGTPVPEPVPEKKIEEKKPPEIEPPELEPPKPPPSPVPTLDSAALAAASRDTAASVVNGTGGGTGNDGSAGTGPGRGGGIGSGVGTGTGSGNGPGTGGGDGVLYPPTVVALPILPLPIPDKVRPYKMVAEFEVDSLGKARLLSFNPSRDAAYNRRIREMLLEIRFRPAVRADGRPVTARAIVTAEAL